MNKSYKRRKPHGVKPVSGGLRSKTAALILSAAVCLSIILCASGISGCSGNTDSLNGVINSGRLIVGIAPDMKPFSFVPDEGDKDVYAGIVDIQNTPKSENNGETGTSGEDNISGSDNTSAAVSAFPVISSGDLSGGDIISDTDENAVSEPGPAIIQDNGSISAEHAEYTGLSVDLAGALTSLLNVDAVLVPVEPERAYEALDNKEIDCYLYLPVVDIKTAATMNTIDTGLDYRQIFVVPESGSITKLSELSDHSLGCVSGTDTAGALAQASLIRSAVSQTVYYSDVDAMLSAVESGDLDAAVINEPVFNYSRREGYSRLHKIDDLLEENDLVIAMTLRDETLSERIQLLYDMLKSDGTIEQLEKKWLSAEHD